MVPMENLSSSEVVDSVLDSGSKAQNVKEKIAKGDSVAGRAEGNSATASMGSGNKDGEIDSLRSQIKEIKSGHMIEIRRLNLSKQAEIENIKAQFKELSSRQKEVFMRQKAKLENAISQIEKLSLRNKELEKELEAERKRGLAPETNVSEATSDFSNPLMDVELLRKENSSLKEKLDQVSLKENLKSKMRVAIKSPSNPPLVGEALRLEIEGISLPEIQWYRSFFGSRGFYKIPGAESREYTTTADDYGSVLKAVVLSPEEIEVESEVGPVEIRKSMIEKISDYISSKKPIEFSIKTPASLKDDQAIQVNKDKVKLRKDKSTYSKREYSSTLAMILDPEKETCFDLRLSEEEALHFTLEAPNRATRDILALTIRAFQYFSLKTPKGKEHDVDYLHYILSQGNRIHSRTLSSLENPLANSNELNANIAEEFPVDLEQSASTSSTIVEHSNSKIFGRRVSQSQSEAHVLSSNLGQKFDDKATETIQEFDDGLERDKDGFIINGDKRRGFTDVDNTIEQDSDDEKLEKSAPIIIKSVEQAKVATDDELRRVAQEMNFNLPPPSSGKRPVNSSGRKKTFTPSSGKRKGKSLSRRGSEQENIINSSITSAENTTISGLKELTKRQDTIEPIAHETLVQSPISFSENVNSTLESRKALFAVLESISYVMQNGKPSDIAAEGSIHVKIIPEASDSMILRYQLSTEDKVKKASPNENIVSSLGDGIFEAKVPAGSGSVSLFNYSIECDTDDVPLILFPDWKITDTSAKLDLQVSLSADFQALESIAVLFALGPLDADISILQAEPSTLKHDKTVQKIMWKLPGLNADQRTATYSIEFASDRRVTPSAIAVQFSCTGFSVSGIHLDCIQLDQSYYALGGIVQKTKSNKVVCKSHI